MNPHTAARTFLSIPDSFDNSYVDQRIDLLSWEAAWMVAPANWTLLFNVVQA